ncbi:MAG TPA: hypothetical protein VI136_19920 [Verrucomicrobiae bacterium]
MSSTAEQEKVVPRQGRLGRLLRFLFHPPPLGPLPSRAGRFAERLAKCPPDLVTHLGMVRANAYYDAGCPLALCDHAAARDIWNVMHADAITKEEAHAAAI